MSVPSWEKAYASIEPSFAYWEKTKDVIDQFLDLALNYRQSGHPGGSRSKVHAFVSLTLSGAMRWDIRRPDKALNDRFVLIAGHTVPLIYCTLATYNEALRLRFEETGDERYSVKHGARWQLTWEDLLGFRRRGGLAGHAEFEGKTLFLKANTGPSGHGFPVAVGMAMALGRAGVGDVRVFAVEGEGGYTAGAAHESINSAWGLGLDNLYLLLDWNDHGIDARAASSVMYGTPSDWFGSHGWRIYGADNGSEWASVSRALMQAVNDPETGKRPAALWFRTRKGRGYGKYDYASHGAPHKMNSPEFWATKKEFQDRYGVRFEGFGEPAPEGAKAQAEQARANYEIVAGMMKKDPDFYRALADRLVEIGDEVPDTAERTIFDAARNPWKDPRLTDFKSYPKEMWIAPGTKAPNRQSLATWGAWANSWARREYSRPLFLAMSADLAESTNIAGFAKPFAGEANYGVYERNDNPEGVLLPQEITEFCNAGMSTGIAGVNFSVDPESEWDGFGAACSTYGSFSYLKYGPMRLYSQLAQDSDFKVGPVIWIAGHSGPETAEDSRTHFGVFSPSVTQLFPEGAVCDLHPWEANEVPVMIAAGLASGIPILALHLTRPAMEIPDREALGMAHYFESARGAYLMRDYCAGERHGCVIVQGTATVANTIKALDRINQSGLNVKIVVATSPQLFALQDEAYRKKILSDGDRIDSMAITNRARSTMRSWMASDVSLEYTLSSDHDDRWRTGGSLEEIIAEAKLDSDSIVAGITRFAQERRERLDRIESMLHAARGK